MLVVAADVYGDVLEATRHGLEGRGGVHAGVCCASGKLKSVLEDCDLS